MANSFDHGRLFFPVLMLLFLGNPSVLIADRVFNALDFGAVGDGETDSAQAIMSAWREACAQEGKAQVVIPRGTFLVGPLVFKGPCKDHTQMQIMGVLKSPADLNIFKDNIWILFDHVDNLIVSGDGKIDGQGALAWPHNHCFNMKQACKLLPPSIKLNYVTNSTIDGIASIDSKLFHVNVHNSDLINLNNIKINAPKNSPNTDGIHIGNSSNITIRNSIISTGDDCISIGANTYNVSIFSVLCGPGHGISIGSLGRYPKEGDVVGVRVQNCTLTGTSNGLRIKTWPASSRSSASNVVFEDILMKDVKNPIIIDQEYCPHHSCNHKLPSMVQISNVKFRNIRGRSASKVAVNLTCSPAAPCHDVEFSEIDLRYSDGHETALASCSNVHGVSTGFVNPPPCF